jgi:hypothetical protein
MRLDNSIQTAISNLLKNPILSILRDINFSSILKQSNFIKRDIGKSPYLVILHFLYMFVINKKISSFAKYSSDSYKKDVYYRLLKNSKYNWRKLLLLTSVKLICKLHKLQKTTDIKVLIIDDTVEIKRGKFIEGSCKNLWSNKEHRAIKGLNIVSLNYSDAYTDMMLDFSINYNKNQVVNVDENSFHHKSNAYKRRDEGNSGCCNSACCQRSRRCASKLFNTRRLTVFFTFFVMLQFWNLFNARVFGTSDSAFKGISKSYGMELIILAILGGQILIVQFGGAVFRTVPLDFMTWMTIVVSTSFVLWIGELVRLIRRLTQK